MHAFQLAQVNIAEVLAPLNDPIMQDFVGNVDHINAMADASEGFIWRMNDEDKDEGAKIFQNNALVINISVWKDFESLFKFTYQTGHVDIFKRKKAWFKKMNRMHMAFWYIPKGYKPTFQDAKYRLDYLNSYGESPFAFSFKSKFLVDDFLNYKPLNASS
ncbi:DUF3291 domain-containing protein [Tamlana fucoidanivorans]|uniref:DUF3291 domain-containing protein n=1 Tax=Allotamlana fucoidanivorans TaxID=2583814 RepID=A0A5C4SDE7_9FLAO|nr:DUF3291 domain-containing protein [Tamlana fucoidanivorans]TNJ41527.1 DUF3291 domain-containing protein [Tamlana fucoidanivorans]